MPEAPLLTHEQLVELEARATEQKAPVVDRFRPGLSSRQIDALIEPLGLQLPFEARLWWSWHDGADVGPSNLAVERTIGRVQFLPLEQAIETYQSSRATRKEAWGNEFRLEEFWPPEWFPIALVKGEVVCDCSVPSEAPTPIRVMDAWLEPEATIRPVTQSLGEAVSWWIDALDRSIWQFNSDSGVWDYDWRAAGGPPRDWLV